ncbi:MAG TPA: ComEC/Rec2 family competence protein [Pyrinomonadaceae bacterium]|jgi:competence protein ComEC
MSTTSAEPDFGFHPLAALAAAFAAGVLLARLTSAPPAACVTLAALATASAVYAAAKRRGTAAARLVVLAFACAGASLSSVEAEAARSETRLRSLYERGLVGRGEPLEVTGVLERAPELAPDGLLLALRVERVRRRSSESPCAGRVELFAPFADARAAEGYDALELRRGARLRVMAPFTRAERYRNPGVEPLADYLKTRDVDARATLKSALLVERLDDEAVLLPLALLDDWRARLVRLSDATFSADASGVFKAAVLGNQHGLSRGAAERFRDAGTFHVLVISGLHIAFVGGLVWGAAGRLTRTGAARWAASAGFVWAYAVAVGAEASVVRAALTFTLAALAPALGRRTSPLNATGGAALALLVWRPANLFDPSFQLTFLSVVAIAGFALPLLSSLKAVGEWRPARATPYPPAAPAWLRTLAEALYWRERAWRRETAHAAHDYRLFKSPLAARLERWRLQAPLRYVFAGLVVSAAVQVLLLPLFVVYFHRLPLAALALNLFAGACVAVHAFAALGALALGQLGATPAAPLVGLTELTTALLLHAADPFAAAGGASLRLPEHTGAASAVYAVYFAPPLALAAALMRWCPLASPPRANEVEERLAAGVGARRTKAGGAFKEGVRKEGGRKVDDAAEGGKRTAARRARLLRASALVFAGAAFVIVARAPGAGRADGRLRLDFLDVGQGDAALVTMPDGSTLLVDGGGRPDFRAPRGAEDEGDAFEPDSRGVGDAVVSEHLWWRGLSRVDYVLATHADADHVEGLSDVLRNFRVGALLVGRAPRGDAEFARLARTAREAGVPVYTVGRGDRLRFGGVAVDVLWPPPGADAEATSGNDDSVVLRLRLGRRAFLLTGDVEARAERALVAAGDALACDALKVAHHGSRTSSTPAFVAAARPALAVIPVGRDSPHGHPHPEVVARWRDSGAQVLTTGERGMVTLSTDGVDLKVETFVRR